MYSKNKGSDFLENTKFAPAYLTIFDFFRFNGICGMGEQNEDC